MLSILYYLIIYPIELLVEVTFSALNLILDNPGLSIVGVSLVINFLILPMYKRSDALQEQERAEQKKLSFWVKHIRKTFHGDEQFMMLQEYYRQNNYKPIYALRGSVSLLLQIPFFVAAYHFLSNLDALQGTSFLFIPDMGKPDDLIKIGSLSINLLPLVMTSVNFLSGAIYTKGFELKDKLQLYIMALLFLVLLYSSPAGLVLYWTCNNVFSLIKNIFLKKLRHPQETFSIISAFIGVLICIFLFLNFDKMLWHFIAIVLLAVLCVPFIKVIDKRSGFMHCIKSGIISKLQINQGHSSTKVIACFQCGVFSLALLTGLLIPSAVISASPTEFVRQYHVFNPSAYLLYSTALAIGCFVIWLNVFFFLIDASQKVWAAFAVWTLWGLSVVNYLFFGKEYGTMTSKLQFNRIPDPTGKERWTNFAVLCGTILLVTIIWKYGRRLIISLYSVCIISVLVMAAMNIYQINSQYHQAFSQHEYYDTSKKIVHLSKNGKNVIVFMLDRAISGYIPYIMNEKPELKQKFSGFIYYPNTVSFGEYTNYCTPALFGGYEYTPPEINKRDQESLESKQNEALKIMPLLFEKNGFDVTVCDPPYAGYKEIPDLSIYDEYPEIHKYNTMGSYSSELLKKSVTETLLKRNLFCYSIFKISPVFFQRELYNSGDYLGSNIPDINPLFIESYSVLQKLPEITEISDDSQNFFFMIDNNTTHEFSDLQLPEYTPAEHVNNSAYMNEWMSQFNNSENSVLYMNNENCYAYFSNMAALLQLGNWFSYLKEQGVWDNTRIIVVSDHGYSFSQFSNMVINKDLDVEAVNPLLMVKDFQSDDYETSETFMTNADVPTLAVEGIIRDPRNPFTEKMIDSSEKNEHPQIITTARNYNLTLSQGNILDTTDGKWYSVHDDIFCKNNWKELPTK